MDDESTGSVGFKQDSDVPVRSRKFYQRKGYISPNQLVLLLALTIAPLLTMTVRMLALPGVLEPGWVFTDWLRTIGGALNHALSLRDVRMNEMDQVFFLLFLPTAAMLIAFARLTLGLRMMGFRSILVAMGFREAGIVPGLILVSVVIGVSVAMRPWYRQLRLPYYARIAVTFCVTVMVLVFLMIAAPPLRSEMLWRLAFFPVLILALMAEAFARTVEEDSVLAAFWRIGTTVAVAIVLTILGSAFVFRETLHTYPEFMISETVAIILIAEFLDFRLLEDFYAKLSGLAVPHLLADPNAYRVAVVRSRQADTIIGWLGHLSPKRLTQRSVQPVVDALRVAGHTVRVFEGDSNLVRHLAQFIPPHPGTGQPGGLVFNLAAGIQGDAHYTHVPSMLQASGVAYTGATPHGHALAHDRYLARLLLRHSGVRTPAFVELSRPDDDVKDLHFPLVVKPRHDSTQRLRVVDGPGELRKAVAGVIRRYGPPALAEEYVDGREFQVCLLGNEQIECLPLVELDAATRQKTCPAKLDQPVIERIHDLARQAFRVSGCRDYVRLNVRLDANGTPYLIEIDNHDILGRSGAFAAAALQAGYTYDRLLGRIVEIARARYLPSGSPAPEAPLRPAGRLRWIRTLLADHFGASTGPSPSGRAGR